MNQIKIILSATIVFISQFVSAQDFKGQWMVSSKLLSISSTTSELNIAFDPSLGKYISNKVGIGGIIDLTYIRPKNDDGITNYSTGPYLKYYFVSFGNRNFIYTRVKALFGESSVQETTIKESKVVHSKFTSEGIGIGYATGISNRLSLDIEPGMAFTQRNNITRTDLLFDIRFEYRFGAGKLD